MDTYFKALVGILQKVTDTIKTLYIKRVLDMKEVDIDIAIRHFAEFMNESWASVMPLLEDRSYTTNESSIADWLQLNWEILVERKVLKLNQYLEVYGEGADFNGASSRITDVSALPNYAVKVRFGKEVYDFLNDESVFITNSDFIEFVSFKDGFYQREPNFEFVLLEDNSGLERVVPIEEVKFDLEEIG